MSCIRVLSQDVVDKIAAGEVIQRPCNAIKELVENSFDAGSTDIVVTVEINNKLQEMNLSVADNGCGIHQDDLQLATVRHATSKLTSYDDLQQLHSFGFRGEALASLSIVSRQMTIISRKKDTNVAYKQLYNEGKPLPSPPTPCARQRGTSIIVDNVLSGIKQRQRSMRLSDEYNRILQVLQVYAVHKAADGISVICEKKKNNSGGGGGGKAKNRSSGGGKNNSPSIDLNTRQHCPAVTAVRRHNNNTMNDVQDEQQQQQQRQQKRNEATKQAIMHVFGSQLVQHLHAFASSLDLGKDDAKYSCTGFVSLSTFSQNNINKKSTCIFFFNDRYVDCPPLKKEIDEVYMTEFSTRPWVYLSITIPPHDVDVNVHPSKEKVTLMHTDKICKHLAASLRQEFSNLGRVFDTSNSIGNTHPKKKKAAAATAASEGHDENNKQQNNNHQNKKQAPRETSNSNCTTTTPTTTAGSATNKTVNKNPYHNNKRKAGESDLKPKKKKSTVPASQLVRTQNATQVGALLPFLVPTQSQSQLSSTQSSSQSPQDSIVETIQHDPDCPLSFQQSQEQQQSSFSQQLDLSQPGAFAVAAAECNCRYSRTRIPRQVVLRPRTAVTQCNYRSIKGLRNKIKKNADTELRSKFKSAYFVGVVSQNRSLIQCETQLCLINHYECSRHLFYQLALNRFSQGTNMAKFKQPIDIAQAIGQMLQFEEILTHHDEGGGDDDDEQLLHSGELLPVSETNQMLAGQAAECLLLHADMLKEYFSIDIEKKGEDDEEQHGSSSSILLRGLPVLLDGCAPPLHALPLFLLRLATEVDYIDERPCFHGVCRELGAYYATMPHDKEEWLPHVRHVLFPALSALLVPPTKLAESESSFLELTKLKSLYQVFERGC